MSNLVAQEALSVSWSIKLKLFSQPAVISPTCDLLCLLSLLPSFPLLIISEAPGVGNTPPNESSVRTNHFNDTGPECTLTYWFSHGNKSLMISPVDTEAGALLMCAGLWLHPLETTLTSSSLIMTPVKNNNLQSIKAFNCHETQQWWQKRGVKSLVYSFLDI